MEKPYFIIKRILDIVWAIVLTVPSTIIVFLCILFIKAETGGPAFFVQERLGFKGKIFKIYKLRTMNKEKFGYGQKYSDIERMTKCGKVIRNLSFDELPQILNIIKGEMSFIGPRPLLVSYYSLYNKDQLRRHDVLPGVSGWAQVNGRNTLTWDEKFALDLWYVDHICFWVDLKIFFLTIINVFKRKGINSCDNETMEQFQGNQ